jgi:DeoR/GlpR family transcriptional regulator of sugar metabolism
MSAERYIMIMDHLARKKSAKIKELASLLDVSSNTIRRDLSHMEEKGMLARVQGGAVVVDLARMMQSASPRAELCQAEKHAIGLEAAKVVKPHTSIIVDAGSTALEFISFLNEIPGLTVLTHSLDVCNTLIAQRGISVIASGGVLNEATHSFVGSPTEHFFEGIHADQLFLGSKGVGIEAGLTNANIHETPVKQKMIASADEIILLADHTKFGKEGLSRFAGLDEIDAVITDAGIDPHFVEELERMGIRVTVARVPHSGGQE